MQFKRKRLRGQNQKVRRTWLSPEGYRIVWRKEVCGVRVPTRFQATVRTIIPNYGGSEGQSFEMWDFTDLAHRLFKTRGKAEESCERHCRLWTKACEATGVRQLTEIFGRLPSGYPAWVCKKLSRKVYQLLTRPRLAKHQEEDETCSESLPDASGPSGHIGTSDISALPTEPVSETPTLASPAEGKGRPMTRTTRRAPSKATSTGESSTAPPAEAMAKGRNKPAAKHTARQSKPSAKRRPSTTTSSTSAGKRSANSQKKKRARCGS